MATQSVVETVNDVNYKVNAEAQAAGSSLAQHLAALNAVHFQQVANGYTLLGYGEAVLQRAGIDVSEGLGRRQELGGALPMALSELAAAIRFVRGQETT